MILKKEIAYCDCCQKKIGEMYKGDLKEIKLPEGDLDNNGIWCGDKGQYIWFHNQTFCCFGHLLQWLSKEHKKLRKGN